MKTDLVEIRIRSFFTGTGGDKGVNVTPGITVVVSRSFLEKNASHFLSSVVMTEDAIKGIPLSIRPANKAEVEQIRKDEENES